MTIASSSTSPTDAPTITEHEAQQVEHANATGLQPVVFIHGLWLLPSSWDRWAAVFEEAGYTALTPGWPDDPDTVAEANSRPQVFAHKTVGQVADHPGARAAADHLGRERPYGPLGHRERVVQASEEERGCDRDRRDAQPRARAHSGQRLARGGRHGAGLRSAIRLAVRNMPLTVWTVGHSTRTLSEFLGVLAAYRIDAVADVRRFPGSRRQPQYNGPALESALHAAGIDYISIPALGGRREPVSDSPASAWRHPAFRGYADHIAGEEFAAGLFELLMVASALRTAVMCAEVLWWRCHRRMIADVLVSLGARVIHIMDAGSAEPHRLTAPARLLRGVLTYAAQ